MKTIAFIIIGIIVVIVLLLGIGLAAVVLVWLWNYKRHQVKKIAKRFARRILTLTRLVKKELKGDAKYTIQQVKGIVKQHEMDSSLQETINSYWVSVRKIIKRFFTNNS